MSGTVKPILAIVPARGGSKGLPGKNIRPLAGLPLIAHAIRFAAMCPSISRCVVSTDSEEIAEVARANGGNVPFLRPADLARDSSPMMPVLTHALLEAERAEGRRYSSVLLLDPTSPGRIPDDLDRAVAELEANPDADGVVACSRPSFNPFFVGVVARNGEIHPAFPEVGLADRRQDVPEFFRINGSLYLWRRNFVADAPANWREGHHRFVEIPEARAFSIDDLLEFRIAELLLANGIVSLPWLAQAPEGTMK